MTEEQRGPALVRDDELTTHLRAIVAPPEAASYWEGLEQRIMTHVMTRIERGADEGRWWAFSERTYQIGLLAAGLTLIFAGALSLRERALERRMAYESVIEAPVPQQVFARRGILPERQATLRAVTDH